MTLAEVQVKWSVILMDRLGLDNFSTLHMKGHVLHRARAHLKVPVIWWSEKIAVVLIRKKTSIEQLLFKLDYMWRRFSLFLPRNYQMTQSLDLSGKCVTVKWFTCGTVTKPVVSDSDTGSKEFTVLVLVHLSPQNHVITMCSPVTPKPKLAWYPMPVVL